MILCNQLTKFFELESIKRKTSDLIRKEKNKARDVRNKERESKE